MDLTFYYLISIKNLKFFKLLVKDKQGSIQSPELELSKKELMNHLNIARIHGETRMQKFFSDLIDEISGRESADEGLSTHTVLPEQSLGDDLEGEPASSKSGFK